MNILICEPSLQQMDAIYVSLTNALANRGREALVFKFPGAQQMEEYLAVSPDPPDVLAACAD